MFIIKTPWKSYWRHSSIVTANFDQLLGTGLMSLLATVDMLFPATERSARYIVCSSSNWLKPRTWDRQHQEHETDSIKNMRQTALTHILPPFPFYINTFRKIWKWRGTFVRNGAEKITVADIRIIFPFLGQCFLLHSLIELNKK